MQGLHGMVGNLVYERALFTEKIKTFVVFMCGICMCRLELGILHN